MMRHAAALLLLGVTAWAQFRIAVKTAAEPEVVLENSRLRARYGRYQAKDAGPKDAIVELIIKPGAENWGNRIDSRSANGSKAPANRLTKVQVLYDGADRKAALLEYGDGLAAEEITIYPDAPWLEIRYLRHAVNIFDTGGIKGRYEIPGAARYPAYPESFYRKESGPPGALAYHGHYILGLYDPATGRGYGRVMPVEDVDVIKLLFDRGFEMFPHYQPHREQRPFTGYLFVVTGGAGEIRSLGKRLAGSAL